MSVQRVKVLASVIVLLAGLAVFSVTPAADAVACTGAVTYSSTSNTIYLHDASKPYTLAAIKAACSSAPLAQTDATNHIWEISGDLIIQNGSTLNIDGSATATDPVAQLRLRSLSDSVYTHVTQLAANYGTLNLNSVHVYSWDDAAGTTDNDTTLPACPSGTPSAQCPRGRAYIRALSYLDPNGTTWDQSTMNITNSEVDHLGYYTATTYGVSYKTMSGCDHLHQNLCGHVFGKETGSNFHDNYMGTYTWGAEGIQFLNNQYYHNIMYGLDPHDVSNDLDIENNHMSYNGDHGLICAEACANLKIIKNESDHNGMVPWTGPAGDDAGRNVHGIMLYRGATNAVIQGNNVHDQPNGAGIAVFDSSMASISGNTLTNDVWGIQVSVGSAGNSISGNQIVSSTQYAFYLYRGSDAPEYTTASGRPTGNMISNNTITTTGSNGIKINEADTTVFSSNTVTGAGGSLYFAGGVGNVLDSNSLISGQKVSSIATSNGPSSTVIENPVASVGVSVDGTSSTDLQSSTGLLFTASGRALPTQVSPTGSLLHLTSLILGSTGNVVITPQTVSVVPATGSDLASVSGSGSTTDIKVQMSTVSPLAISAGSFTAGRSYTVSRSGTTIATVTADASGNISLTDNPLATGTYDYTFIAV